MFAVTLANVSQPPVGGDGGGAEQGAGGRAGADLDGAAGARRGDPGGELGGVVQQVRRVGDPVAVLDEAGGAAALGRGVVGELDAGLGAEVLALAVLGLQRA